MFRKSSLLIIAVLCNLSLYAQNGNFFQYADSILKQRYHRINYDTNFISRPNYPWTIKIRPKLSLYGVQTETIGKNGLMKVDLKSSPKGKVSFSLGYSGITLSASAKPEHLTRAKEQDLEFRFDVYSRKFGFEAEASLIHSLEGSFLIESALLIPSLNGDSVLDLNLPNGFVSQANFFLSGYYVFNNRKFSYPAAFTQSYIQKRSTGSLIAGANLGFGQLTLGDSTQGTELYQITNLFISMGVGYGYNFVLPHNWLFHISAIPYLIIHNKAICRFGGESQEWQTKFPQVIIIARAAAIRSWERWFTGLTAHYMYSHIGSQSLIEIANQQWHLMAIIGLRF